LHQKTPVYEKPELMIEKRRNGNTPTIAKHSSVQKGGDHDPNPKLVVVGRMNYDKTSQVTGYEDNNLMNKKADGVGDDG